VVPPAVTTTSYSAGSIVVASLNGSASYDIALSVGPAIPGSDPLAITLLDGQIFNLDFSTVSFVCPGGPAPCLSGPFTPVFLAFPPGLVITGQVVVFGIGPLGVSLSQPFTMIADP
jgi:hypothetical protein